MRSTLHIFTVQATYAQFIRLLSADQNTAVLLRPPMQTITFKVFASFLARNYMNYS